MLLLVETKYIWFTQFGNHGQLYNFVLLLPKQFLLKMEITIRNAVELDFPQIVELIRELAIFEKTPQKMTNNVEKMTKEKEFFNSFVAETTDKKIVGYTTYIHCYFTWVGKSLYMDDLYVKPEFRGKGIGTKLLQQVIVYAKSSQCHKIRWQVSSWNTPAMDLYRKLGASIDGVEQNCELILDES